MEGARGAALALAAVASLLAPSASAHSVGWSLDAEAEAAVVSFGYAGGEPMAFADVTVTAPDGQVWQRGRADREGRFAVAWPPGSSPDEPWTVAAVDGEGHALTAAVAPGGSARAGALSAATASALGWLAIGASLLSLVLGGLLLDRRRPGAGARA